MGRGDQEGRTIPELKEGQIWLYNGAHYYRISNIRPTCCQIQKVRKSDDEWQDSDKKPTTSYALDNFEGNASWKFVEDALLTKECAGCGENKVIPEGDFLCAECRGAIPMQCRLVAEVIDQPTIVTLTGTKEYIKLQYTDDKAIVIQREDLPQIAIAALQAFIA